ncbi:MAG: Fe-S oxidoreductase subunit, GlpC family [Candidatus Methanohalarchaeum thermophilum]|uniref:Fe-S oxidoreductase subunit, GlpC family n=1 Tax=Methanohalarchaeum thermophilum TaxID=1903181 RepID=A0A1Q6DUI4_METT1|nr:MAG: Fe-S oxidoreductase subunit, GlpC family [Candidatus Methanohalarchaeum thermophilum]
MDNWFEKEIELSSLTQEEPGLLELMTKRIINVSYFSFIFHVGVIFAILTGILISVFAVVPGITKSLGGMGWVISWGHAILGIILIIGLIGVLGRYSLNKSFRKAYGKYFYFFLFSLLILSITGIISTLKLFEILPLSYGLFPVVHGIVAYGWLIGSGLILKGSVRHGFASVYRSLGKKPKEKTTFTDACAMCGKCIEVCPNYNALEEDEEAPAYKVRRYLDKVSSGKIPKEELKTQIEDVYVCSLCGLCVGVCPYSYDHVDLYLEVLNQGEEKLGSQKSGEAN